MGTASRTREEASSTEKAVTTGEEERVTLSQNEMCTEGSGPRGVMNVGGDGGVRLTVAEGVALHEACTAEATKECLDDGGACTRAASRHVGGARRSVTAVRTPTRGPTITRLGGRT